ncbi:MAG: RagB/SusD family nutrient uptake outer membrane protein [Tidjanibacter sp.]|nr:RagB/SusD family nutrient uptake outer membrane protein [Tidjanibacter sp.]MBR7128966.1 RagB/SusD family nutrient uptake outer membrane protein [Tidjanibacter sp.]
MKLNKIILSILGLSVLLASCENAEFLERKPYSQTSPDNFYTTESAMQMGLIGCYEIITARDIPGATYIQRGNYAQGMIFLMNGPSDTYVSVTNSSDSGVEAMWGSYHEGTKAVREMWKTMYAGISRCNTLLHYLPNVEMEPEKKVQYEAEARFLRAFYYYHLAWGFGGVPVVLDYDSDGQEPRSSLEKVYEQILADFQFAYENLGESGMLGTASANKYTAAAYIGRMCNYLAACKRNGTGKSLVAEQPLNDFAWVDEVAMSKRAYDVLKDVVDNSKYILVDDYTNLFREGLVDVYKESLLTAELAMSTVAGYWPNSYYLPGPPNGGTDSPIVYGGYHNATPDLFYMYDKADPRRDHNLTSRLSDGKVAKKVGGYTYWDPVIDRSEANTSIRVNINEFDEFGNLVPDPEDPTKPKVVSALRPLYDSPTQTYYPNSGLACCIGKIRFMSTEETPHTASQHAYSYPLMRMADVYLMYAEAIYFHKGDEGLARQQLDIVLERACRIAENPTETFKTLKQAYHRDNFIDELLESRERELVMEFSRKWDLIRYNIIDERIANMSTTYIKQKIGQIPANYLTNNKTEKDYLNIPTTSPIYMGGVFLQDNWEPYKIWFPISEEQIGVNKNLTQNAGWTASKGEGESE